MIKSKLILIGAGGHCKSCIDVINQEGKYEIVGILDLPEKKGENILGYEVIGCDEDIRKYHDLGCEFLITIGQIKSAITRKNIFNKLVSLDAKIATIISPRAYVSSNSVIDKGTIVMHHAFVNAGAFIGENCIINTGSIIEHDAKIGAHSHISTSAIVNGDCKIGHETFVGSNATISSQVNVGNNIVIGAGSLVIKNVESNQTVVGVPAKKIR